MRVSIVVFVIACGSAASDTRAPRPTPIVLGDASPCDDEQALQAHANTSRPCAMAGVYSLKEFRGKGGVDLGSWPIVTLADGSQVMLESLHHPERRPDAATIARFRGKRVHVIGTLHSSPPRDLPANFFHWTLSPVTSIELAPD